MGLVRRFYAAYGQTLGGAAIRDGEEIEKALRAGGYLNRVLEQAWPAVLPGEARAGALHDARLPRRGGRRPPHRRGAAPAAPAGSGWSDGDVPLLDEAHALVGEPARTFGHVIVDEAQDLTPMQLRMVARRARDGSLTALGDVAQGTGAVVYGSWQDVLRHLPRGDEAEVEELRHAYRVPREIMELALPLLDLIAPDVERPRRVPDGRRRACHPAGAGRRAPPGGIPRGRAARARGGSRRADRPGRARRARARRRRRLRGRAAPDAAPGEGPRVRPRDRGRAGADRGARAGPPAPVRLAHEADEVARRPPRAPASGRA